MLAEAATTRLTDSTIKRMQDVIDMQDRAVRAGDPLRFTELDREFHFLLYRSAGYARAYDMIQELRDASDRYVRFYAVYKDGAAESLGEHRRILQLCTERDIAGVRHEVEHHIMRGLDTLRTIAGEMA
jgi:DNA-binding GntR family transcriptional regulator